MSRLRGERLPPVRKSLGQHFLTDRRILGRIVDALDVSGDDTVVEIGPGRGALTDVLRERMRGHGGAGKGRIVAVEYDRALATMLRDHYSSDPCVNVVQADVLATDLGVAAGGGDYLLVGNLPYYITTPILFHALRPPRPRRAVFLVQLEVAERMTAPPGSREYGALTVNLQAIANVERLFRVPPGAFQPPPKVDSAVVRVAPRDNPLVQEAEQRTFRELVQAAFGMRRKQIRRVIRQLKLMDAREADAILDSCDIAPDARPETLSPPQFVTLHRRLARVP